MRKEDCFFLGRIVKKYSYKGELLVTLDTDEPEMYTQMESVLLELNHSLIPFFIEESSLHKSRLLRVKFEDVTSEADAEALIGSELFLPLDMLPKLSGNKFYFHEVMGFKAIDQQFGLIGTITSVNDQTAQPIFVIERGDKEVLIPLNDEFIVELKRDLKEIHLDVPEGLIELYLQ